MCIASQHRTQQVCAQRCTVGQARTIQALHSTVQWSAQDGTIIPQHHGNVSTERCSGQHSTEHSLLAVQHGSGVITAGMAGAGAGSAQWWVPPD